MTQFFRRWWPNLVSLSLIFWPPHAMDTPSHCGNASQLKNHASKVPILVVFVTTTISVIIGFWKWCFYDSVVSATMHLWSCLDCQLFKKYMIWYGLDNFEKKFMCHFIRIAHTLICHRRHSALAEASYNHHLFFKKIASDSWYLVAHFLASQWWHQRYRTHVGYSIQKF